MKMKDMSTYPSLPLKNGRAPQSKDSRRLNKTGLTLIAVCLYSVSSSFLFMSSAFFETDSTPMAFPSRVLQERVDEKVRKDTIREKLKARKRRRCKCLECDKDKEDCGQLWKGIQYSTAGRNIRRGKKKVHIVISHCKNDLSWVSNVSNEIEHHIESIHVITKCGENVTGVPNITTVERLPNIGRCDHSYAYYLHNILDQKIEKGEENESVVLFLKDDISEDNKHQIGSLVPIQSMIDTASSTNGFACRLQPGIHNPGQESLKRYVAPGRPLYSYSAYHHTSTLMTFTMNEYERNQKGYNVSNEVKFRSNFTNIGEFFGDLGDLSMQKLVPLCYGGVFAASVSNIKRQDSSVWQKLETILSRGDNIEEGHYAERSWAMLLSLPLEDYKLDALLQYTDNVSIRGALTGPLLKMIRSQSNHNDSRNKREQFFDAMSKAKRNKQEGGQSHHDSWGTQRERSDLVLL